MEIIDIVDEKDQVIGQAAREEAHKNPSLIHRAVHFTLINRDENTILLTQRSFSKSNDAGKYCFLGEHLTTGETYEQAVKRGFEEELGVDVADCEELGSNIFRYDTQTELVKFYVCDYKGGNLNFDKQEIEQLLWIGIDKLSNLGDIDLDLSDMTKYWIEHITWKL